ncbi:beta-ketoacyl-ACP synthase 3 [bacterium]|nr:beta-ketoacyl-ACP synthase 3 [bacterium]
MSAIVEAFSRYLPPKVVTNEELSSLMETSDEWIQQRSGIRERRFVDAPTTTSDLAVEAARKTLGALQGKSVDAIIAATLSPDYDFPGIGVLIQAKLDLPTIPAFDLRNQCSGFLYGLELATALVQQEQYERILLVGAEVHSTGLDLSTRGRDIAVLFGDGAGSCVVSREEARATTGTGLRVLRSELHGDGAHAPKLWCEHIGSAHFPHRMDASLIEEGKCFPSMQGRKVFEHAVKRMVEVSLSVLEKEGITPEQIRFVVPHQANARINGLVAEQLGIPGERVSQTITHYGNTTAATIPIGFSHVLEEEEIHQGDYLLSCAFGSGFTWGATLLQAV